MYITTSLSNACVFPWIKILYDILPADPIPGDTRDTISLT
jgi:hypothetical protein